MQPRLPDTFALTGQLGLRLEMGIKASIGFGASGRCAVVVCRETTAPCLRLRIYRLKTREFDAALNAGVSVAATETVLPGKIDDFITAVFDLHGQQILHDLKALELWTNPASRITSLLENGRLEGAEQLIAHIAGVTPAELQQKFSQVQATAIAFITRWHQLPHAVSSVLLKLLEEKADLAPVRKLAGDLHTATPAKVTSLLEGYLSAADFFQSPVGRLLEAAAEKGALSLLSKPLSAIQSLGGQLQAVLDGSAIEQTLQRFQDYLESQFTLARLASVNTEADLAKLDPLYKQRLAGFMGRPSLELASLAALRTSINTLVSKRQEYYEKAIAALHHKYSFEVAAAFQSTTSDEALVDAHFDFSKDAAQVSAIFQDAVRGKLDALFTQPHPQIRLNSGTLTHRIRRQTQVDVTLPFVSFRTMHINEAMAKVTPSTHEGGLLFSLDSSDLVASNNRKSLLSMTMGLSAVGHPACAARVYDERLAMNYSLVYAKQNMKPRHLRAQIEPAVATYFNRKVSDVGAFVSLLDRRAEEHIPNTPGVLGNGLISIEVSLPEDQAKRAGAAWLSLPADIASPAYRRLSVGIQVSLKKSIHDAYFTEPEKYLGAIGVAEVILAYCALVPRANTPAHEQDLPYWDFVSRDERREMLRKLQTVTRMQTLLEQAQVTLASESQSDRDFFRPADAARILGRVDVDNPLLKSVLTSEADVILHSFAAGRQIAKFMGVAGTAPSEAITALSKFGSKLTEAFHSDISDLLGAGMPALGTRVFVDASNSIAEQGGSRGTDGCNSLLTVQFFKPGAPFDARALAAEGLGDPSQVAFTDRIIQLG